MLQAGRKRGISGAAADRLPQAIHSGEMEGLSVTDATKADTDEYVTGQIDLDELAAKVRARYGID